MLDNDSSFFLGCKCYYCYHLMLDKHYSECQAYSRAPLVVSLRCGSRVGSIHPFAFETRRMAYVLLRISGDRELVLDSVRWYARRGTRGSSNCGGRAGGCHYLCYAPAAAGGWCWMQKGAQFLKGLDKLFLGELELSCELGVGLG